VLTLRRLGVELWRSIVDNGRLACFGWSNLGLACASSLSYCAKTRFRDLLRLSAIGAGSDWLSLADMEVKVVLAEHFDSPDAVRACPVSDVVYESITDVYLSVVERAVDGRGTVMPRFAAFADRLSIFFMASSELRPKTWLQKSASANSGGAYATMSVVLPSGGGGSGAGIVTARGRGKLLKKTTTTMRGRDGRQRSS
jgi:hypothetical protein